MHRHLILPALVGGLVAVSGCAAMAQASPASTDCSGFMCKVFGSKIEERPAPAPAAAAVQPVSTPDVADPDDDRAKPAARKVAKPLPTVTIAADRLEAPRLKALEATLPKTRIRVVAPNAEADFRLSTALGPAGPAEKARLFTEALHVVAGPDVHALADLKDKVVSFGPIDGPSQDAARKAFASLGIAVKETPLDLDNALDGVSTGDVAAVVVLAPQPDRALSLLKPGSGLHLLAWPDGAALPEGSTAVTLSDYPSLGTSASPVRAVGVEVALEAAGRGAAGAAAKSFLTSLAQHSATLSKRGFDLIKADLESRGTRRVASAERR